MRPPAFTHLTDQRLHSLIGRYAAEAVDAKQISRRLRALLEARLKELIRAHATSAGCTQARAERLALVDPRYLNYVNELVLLSGQAARARIQYETHLMLHQARRSLARFWR